MNVFPHANVGKLLIIKGVLWFMIIMPVIVLFFQDNGLSLHEIMLLQASYSMSVALMEIPSGYAADVLGRRKTMLLGCILACAGFAFFSVSYDFWWFLTAEILLGLGNSFISGSDTALMYDSLRVVKSEDQFLKYEGMSISIGNFSEAAAGILGGFLAALSLRYPAYAQVLVSLIAIPFAYLLIEPDCSKSSKRNSALQIKAIFKASLIENKLLRTYIIYSSAIGVGTLMMAWLAQPFLKDIGIALEYYGLIWAFLNITVAVFSFIAHKIEGILPKLSSIFIVGFITVFGYICISDRRRVTPTCDALLFRQLGHHLLLHH